MGQKDRTEEAKERQFFTTLLVLEGREYNQRGLEATLGKMTVELELDLVGLHGGIIEIMKEGLEKGWIKLVGKEKRFIVDVRNYPLYRALIASDSPEVQAAIDHEIDTKLKEASAKHAAEPSAEALLKQLSDPKALASMEKKVHAELQRKKAERRKKPRKPNKFKLDIKMKASQLSRRALHPS